VVLKEQQRQQPDWDDVGPKRSHSSEETGVLSRPQIQPISGIVVHRVMGLILIRHGKWEFLCPVVNFIIQIMCLFSEEQN
jgi:hypothetical protein